MTETLSDKKWTYEAGGNWYPEEDLKQFIKDILSVEDDSEIKEFIRDRAGDKLI